MLNGINSTTMVHIRDNAKVSHELITKCVAEPYVILQIKSDDADITIFPTKEIVMRLIDECNLAMVDLDRYEIERKNRIRLESYLEPDVHAEES